MNGRVYPVAPAGNIATTIERFQTEVMPEVSPGTGEELSDACAPRHDTYPERPRNIFFWSEPIED